MPDLRTVSFVDCQRHSWRDQAAKCLAKCPRFEPALVEPEVWKRALEKHWFTLGETRSTTGKKKAEGNQGGERGGDAQPVKVGKGKGKGKKVKGASK